MTSAILESARRDMEWMCDSAFIDEAPMRAFERARGTPQANQAEQAAISASRKQVASTSRAARVPLKASPVPQVGTR